MGSVFLVLGLGWGVHQGTTGHVVGGPAFRIASGVIARRYVPGWTAGVLQADVSDAHWQLRTVACTAHRVLGCALNRASRHV
jgi:hypothetical protein